MNFVSRRGLWIGFGLILCVLLVNGAVSFYSTRDLYEIDRWVNHTHEVLATLDQVMALVRDAEASQRGYLITGQERFLAPYLDAAAHVDEKIDALEKRLADNREQAERIPPLRQAVATRLNTLQKLVDVRREQGFPAAQDLILQDLGRQQMQTIRERIAVLVDDEQRLLAERQVDAQKTYLGALVANGMMIVASLLVVATAWILTGAELRLRRKAEAQAVEQREWLSTTLASIGDAVIVTDEAGRIVRMNAVAQSLTQWNHEALGRPLEMVFKIVNEETRRAVENPAAKVLRDGTIVGLANHTILIGREGREIPIDDSAAPIRNAAGRIQGVVLVFRDVTARKLAEDQLKEADRRKDLFLATLAHELRNPIAPISNALQIWPRVAGDPEKLEQLRGVMDRQLQLLIRMVDDLLDVSRITRGKIEMRRQVADVGTLVQGAVESVRPLIDRFEQQLAVSVPSEPLRIDCDVARMIQVLGNLLNNASKYTGRHGRITISAERANGDVVLRVADNGPGIPQSMLERVFEMFTQVDQTLDRSHGGLGIGLTLVKALVQMHGGTVTAHSEGQGRGAEFEIRLPLAGEHETSQPISQSSDVQQPAAPRHRVLVVDDVQASAKTLEMMLRSIDQEVETCNDGLSALHAVVDYRPSAVFLDIGMPGMDGYQVAEHIRRIPGCENLTLVALTGYGQEEDRRRALESGFSFHLTKPTNLDMLEQILSSIPPPVDAQPVNAQRIDEQAKSDVPS